MLFDTHAHYDSPKFDGDRDAILTSMPEKGVGLIIDPGCDVESSRKAVELAERYHFLYAAVGFQPEDCAGADDKDFEELGKFADAPKTVAIGEIGLDYYWKENPPKEFQKEVFRREMAMAQEKKLPAIVHDREAHADCMEIIREFPDVTGVFHCYSGAWEMAKELLDRGWYLGFNGAVTFKNARKAPEVIRKMPLDRLLLETDSPYLTPVPYRGKRNDSGYLPLVVEKIAAFRSADPAEIEEAAWENGWRLFRIGGEARQKVSGETE